MRTRNALERLAAAGTPLHAGADKLVDDGEEDRILTQILGLDRQPVVDRGRRRGVLVLAGAVIVAASVVTVATDAFNNTNKPVAKTSGPHRIALTGPRIQLAGYDFRTPAGFTASDTACQTTMIINPRVGASDPRDDPGDFAAAASADGGCLEAFAAAGVYAKIPTGAQAVDVGNYQGYVVPPDSSGASAIYLALPQMGEYSPYLVLFAHGLTQDQLIAVAQSGLPANP
ncbi:MAG: hypothetical protein ACRDLM_03060 [Gaiellaceae bacterium]